MPASIDHLELAPDINGVSYPVEIIKFAIRIVVRIVKSKRGKKVFEKFLTQDRDETVALVHAIPVVAGQCPGVIFLTGPLVAEEKLCVGWESGKI